VNNAQVHLIHSAIRAIEEAAAGNRGGQAVPFFGPTDLQSMDTAEREAAARSEDRFYREQPEQAAVHFCLTSATALLDVAHTLLSRSAHHQSPQERERELSALVAHAKMAGRSAYRAALVLTDTKTAG